MEHRVCPTVAGKRPVFRNGQQRSPLVRSTPPHLTHSPEGWEIAVSWTGRAGILGATLAWAWGVGRCWSAVAEPLESGVRVHMLAGLRGVVHEPLRCKCGLYRCPCFWGRFFQGP